MPGSSHAFLGRQPIVDRRGELLGYELLYRASDTDDHARFDDEDSASLHVLSTLLHDLGAPQVLAGKLAFVNVGPGSLRDAGALAPDDCLALCEAYHFCNRVRDARFLLTGRPVDSLPTVPEDAEKLGRLLGYLDHPQVAMREDFKRLTRRARAVVDRVFYEA